ncbi:hypothetical protein TBK1r_05940 [Stieleria magnilauensis]|uniref:Uncharacterized protein n=1 Tax=Stieleria magnilauensis TaxID=2527963 RepID=A0ABX5XI69_9BACT|nr:hypothetical protein TBK1r_05940 [Planctomycetes bacterium TBK1r]
MILPRIILPHQIMRSFHRRKHLINKQTLAVPFCEAADSTRPNDAFG